MSGHSKWSTIKHKKAATDAKRGKLFTRLAREIAIAAREGGGNPETNFSLRLAMDKAKGANMPKDNIERAIKRGSGELKGEELVEFTYEGYAPNGVGLLIDSEGDDRYFVKNPLNTQGYGNPRRDFGSIGLFIDLGGSDQYDGNGRDNYYWRTDSKWGGGMDEHQSRPFLQLGRNRCLRHDLCR